MDQTLKQYISHTWNCQVQEVLAGSECWRLATRPACRATELKLNLTNQRRAVRSRDLISTNHSSPAVRGARGLVPRHHRATASIHEPADQ